MSDVQQKNPEWRDRAPGLPAARPARPAFSPRVSPWRPEEVNRPRVVDRAFWMWMLASLATMVTVVICLLHFDELKGEMLATARDQFPDKSADDIDQVAGLAVGVLLGLGALCGLLYMAFALLVRDGSGWARHWLVGFGILGLVLAGSTAHAVPGDVKVAMVATALITVVGAVALYLPGAGPWYAHKKWRRQGHIEPGTENA